MTNNTWYDLFHSRKFWAAVIGLALVIAHHFISWFPMTDEQIAQMIYVLIAYILGTGLEDAGISSLTVGGLGK